MSATQQTTRPAITDEDIIIAQQRHQDGLAAAASLLTEPDAYTRILKAEKTAHLDNALQQHALALATLNRSTTARLEMSRTAAHLVLHVLVTTFDEI